MNKNRGLLLYLLGGLVMVLVLTSLQGQRLADRKPDVQTCASCGRSFEAGDAGGNYDSISETGMCRSCYDRYRNTHSSSDEMEV